MAERAGVSTATVSHVINNTRYVAPLTVDKVNEALQTLHYQPNYVAKSLRAKKSKTIGVLIQEITRNFTDAYMMQVAYGIRMGLDAKGYNMILSATKNAVEDELKQIKALAAQQADGLIIMPCHSETDYLSPAMEFSIPMVFIDRKVKGSYGDCVICDNFQGSYDAVTALIQKGHRKIGIIAIYETVTTLIDRLRGYKHALRDAALDINDRRVMLIRPHEYCFEDSIRCMREMVEDRDVTAVFVADNLCALGALSYINASGIRIPDDLAFVTFDDSEWELAMKPTISTVRQTPYEMGLKAAQLLLERIENPDRPFETCLLATKFIPRESM